MPPSPTLRRLPFAVLPLAVAIALSGCRSSPNNLSDKRRPPAPLSGVTVVLDPGHGGEDSGAIRAGVREDVINYRMASAIASELRERGASVVFTIHSEALLADLRPGKNEPALRVPDDACLAINGQPVRLRKSSSPDDLYGRAAIAQNLWRDLPSATRLSGRGVYFLSLHCDKLQTSHGRGARVYFDNREKTPSRFAKLLRERLTAAGLTNSAKGMVIPRHYGVLNPAYNPIPERALMEMATLSNPGDRSAVMTPKWRWRLAQLVADTITRCDSPASQAQLATRQSP